MCPQSGRHRRALCLELGGAWGSLRGCFGEVLASWAPKPVQNQSKSIFQRDQKSSRNRTNNCPKSVPNRFKIAPKWLLAPLGGIVALLGPSGGGSGRGSAQISGRFRGPLAGHVGAMLALNPGLVGSPCGPRFRHGFRSCFGGPSGPNLGSKPASKPAPGGARNRRRSEKAKSVEICTTPERNAYFCPPGGLRNGTPRAPKPLPKRSRNQHTFQKPKRTPKWPNLGPKLGPKTGPEPVPNRPGQP